LYYDEDIMPNLTLNVLSESDLPIPGADPWFARPEDAAIAVMIDFRERASVTIAESTLIDAALEHMKHAGVRCAFATSDARRVVGLITAYDILSEKPMRHIQSVAGQRKDVQVRDIMVRVTDWRTADVTDLERITVGSLYKLFDDTQLTHIPVMESNAGQPPRLRGLLSASKVRRLLSK
jgi:CBS domain-containing protein